jgi:carbon-monoxide dehydrogenase medium subunit
MYYRRLPKFEYLAPKSIEEAGSMLQEYKGDAKVTAGGTIVVHRMKERIGVRKVLIGLKKIPELDSITFDAFSGLRIGAMATLQSVADSPLIMEKYDLLSKVCAVLGTPHIRNMGTIGGNVSCKLPAAETVPALIALCAEAKLVSTDGERMVPIEDLNKELKQTDLLTEICVPASSANKMWGYEKFAVREKLDYAVASAAVVILSGNGTCEDCRIALGGVPSKRATEAERMLKGQAITNGLVEDAANKASQNAKTTSDIEFSAEYKKELLKIMVMRALKQARGE